MLSFTFLVSLCLALFSLSWFINFFLNLNYFPWAYPEKRFIQNLRNSFFKLVSSIRCKNTLRTNINLFDFKKSPFYIFSNKINYFFYQRAIKWTLLPRAGQINPLSDPIVEKKLCATREKHLFYSCGCYPRFARASNFTLAK